jgi:D-glycero-alpha-D-manno-heptose 1-phosphate guanylyltransferase
MTSAIILAGGRGTRLREAVPDRPKPMALVNRRPFLVHLLDYWLGQNIRHFVLSVGYLHEVIQQFFGTHYRGARLDYAVEERPLGTGGGLLLAQEWLPDAAPFLLLNGDTFFAVDASALLDFHHRRQADWTLSLFRAPEADRYMGVRLEADGRIADLAAGRAAPGTTANGGVYAVNPAVLRAAGHPAATKLSLEEDLLPVMHRQGLPLYGLAATGLFIDIGIPADYRRAQEILP